MALSGKDPNKLGTYHITDNIQSYEVARSNFFKVIVTGLKDTKLIYPEYSYEQTAAEGEDASRMISTYNGQTDQDVISLSVNKMFVPHFKLGYVDVKRGNSTVRFAGTPEWESGTMELEDFVGIETKNVIMAWQALAYDVNTDRSGRAGDYTDEDGVFHYGYKRDCELIEYTPDFQIVRTWRLIGCWPSSITESTFEVEGTGGRAITVQLEYDRAYMEQDSTKFATKTEE